MIRSFKDKLKKKQEAYEAKQRVLAEQAEQDRIKCEWEEFDREQKAKQVRVQQILIEEAYRKEQEYLNQKRIQDEKNQRRIEEFEAWKADELTKAELSKKLIAEGKIVDAERYIARSKQKSKVKKKRGINEGAPMNAPGTWKLTWKSFSTHPDVIDLPMSEKVRLYKLAEQRQTDRTNYYANLHSAQNSLGSAGIQYPWSDGVINLADGISEISESVTWPNSVDVNIPLTINAGVTLIIQGIVTVNAVIINNGTINASQGIIINSGNIDNTNGTLIVP